MARFRICLFFFFFGSVLKVGVTGFAKGFQCEFKKERN